jgi:hypothetical protein
MPPRASDPQGAAGPNAAKGDDAMKKEDVVVGGTYLAKVGARSVEVTIESENAKGGWNAKSVASGKPVRLKDPKHLRPAKAADAGDTGHERGDGGDGATGPAKARKRATAAKRGGRPKEAKSKAMSCLDAAAAVLKANGGAMACRPLIDAMKEQGLWTSSAPTPHATLFSALLRELRKGDASRFRKVDRGQFAFQEPKGE